MLTTKKCYVLVTISTAEGAKPARENQTFALIMIALVL